MYIRLLSLVLERLNSRSLRFTPIFRRRPGWPIQAVFWLEWENATGRGSKQ
jgi:hypothetical protein